MCSYWYMHLCMPVSISLVWAATCGCSRVLRVLIVSQLCAVLKKCGCGGQLHAAAWPQQKGRAAAPPHGLLQPAPAPPEPGPGGHFVAALPAGRPFLLPLGPGPAPLPPPRGATAGQAGPRRCPLPAAGPPPCGRARPCRGRRWRSSRRSPPSTASRTPARCWRSQVTAAAPAAVPLGALPPARPWEEALRGRCPPPAHPRLWVRAVQGRCGAAVGGEERAAPCLLPPAPGCGAGRWERSGCRIRGSALSAPALAAIAQSTDFRGELWQSVLLQCPGAPSARGRTSQQVRCAPTVTAGVRQAVPGSMCRQCMSLQTRARVGFAQCLPEM